MKLKYYLFILPCILFTMPQTIVYGDSTLTAQSIETITQLEKKFTTIKKQVETCQKSAVRIDYNRAIDNLNAYLTNPQNDEINRAFRMVLLPEYYKKITQFNTVSFTIDGNADKWSPVPDFSNDTSGDGCEKTPETDLVKAAAYIDADDNLFVMFKTAAKPKHQQYFDVTLDVIGDKSYDFEIYFTGLADGRINCRYNDLKSGKSGVELTIDGAIGEIAEARIPLRGLSFDRKKLKDTITVFPRLLDMSAQNFDAAETIMIDQDTSNYALILLFYLLDKGCYMPGDTVSMAIAMTESYIYASATSEVRKMILNDIVNLYRYYERITAWQAEGNLSYDLRRVPLMAKMFWTNRAFYDIAYAERDDNNRLSAEFYRTYVMSPETLAAYHDLCAKNGLVDKNGARATQTAIEAWVSQKLRYHFQRIDDIDQLPDDEKEAFRSGRNVITIGNQKKQCFEVEYPTFQLDWYRQYGFFTGFCGMHNSVTRAMMQAIGVPTDTFLYITTRKKGNSFEQDNQKTHTFPVFYDTSQNKWFATQVPSHNSVAGEDTKFYMFKLIPHNRKVIRHFNEEKKNFSDIRNLLQNGISEPLFEKTFFSK